MIDRSAKYFLVGMMGSGKSTIGKTLSSKWSIPFWDMDEQIESVEHCSIREIFEKSGESYFRLIEHRVLEKFLSLEGSFVLATGGGVGGNESLMDAMRKVGIVIFLDTDFEAVLLRLSTEEINQRPLLSKDDQIATRWRALYNQRLSAYQMADFTIDTRGKSVEHIVSEIEQKIHS